MIYAPLFPVVEVSVAEAVEETALELALEVDKEDCPEPEEVAPA